jgi:hypothetical protein
MFKFLIKEDKHNMAEINSIKFREDGIFLALKITKEEYEFLQQATADIIIVPAGSKPMDRLLTTGKLGNSSRLMLPKKALDRLEVKAMDKKVPGRLFKLEGSVYLLVRLHENKRRKANPS